MQTSIKFWNGELIFLKGLDLAYMPHIVVSEETEDFNPPVLIGDALHHAFKFCECLGFQLTQDSFMMHDLLFKLGCKFYFKVFRASFYTCTFLSATRPACVFLN